jgi:hypothetical protein
VRRGRGRDRSGAQGIPRRRRPSRCRPRL